jgi:virulence-associated protein VagC
MFIADPQEFRIRSPRLGIAAHGGRLTLVPISMSGP